MVIAQLKGDISDKSKCLTEIERQLSLVTEEKQKLTLGKLFSYNMSLELFS